MNLTAFWTIGGDFVIGDAEDEDAPLIKVEFVDSHFRTAALASRDTVAGLISTAMRQTPHPHNLATGTAARIPVDDDWMNLNELERLRELAVSGVSGVIDETWNDAREKLEKIKALSRQISSGDQKWEQIQEILADETWKT